MRILIQRILGFSIVGVVVTIISLLLLWFFNDVLSLNIYVAYVFAYTISIVLSYFLNARYVWMHTLSAVDILKYLAIYLSSMALGTILLFPFQLLLPEWNHTLLSFTTIPFTMIWNYLFVNYIFTHDNR
ncbi:MAG: GtrA family protein [Prevotellaceae bacterium]|nr:GtrA family protein [Candidatus Faecinaster equi]